MPEFTITFNWVNNYREKLVTLVDPVTMDMDVASESKTNVTLRAGVEFVKRVDGVDDAYVFDHVGFTSTAVKYQSKALFSIHGITYRAPTYASPNVAAPRLFKNISCLKSQQIKHRHHRERET